MVEEALLDIVSYCIGSSKYKSEKSHSFLTSVNKLDKHFLTASLNRFHLTAIFAEELQKLNPQNNYLDILHPFIVYQSKLNDYFLNVLKTLQKYFSKSNIDAVLLKGPAFWDNIYKKYFLRRVEDIDLMILDIDSVYKTCETLLELGYLSQSKDYKEKILDKKSFGLSHFRKVAELDFSEEEYRRFKEYFLIAYPGSNINSASIFKFDNGKININAEIEIHKSIFTFEDGGQPKMEPSFFEDYNVVKGYKILKIAPNLPYLATKAFYDSYHNCFKCVKLYADFVNLLVESSQDDIQQSLSIAREWKCMSYYLVMLNTVKELVPELDLQNLAFTKQNPLRDLLKNLHDHAECGCR